MESTKGQRRVDGERRLLIKVLNIVIEAIASESPKYGMDDYDREGMRALKLVKKRLQNRISRDKMRA